MNVAVSFIHVDVTIYNLLAVYQEIYQDMHINSIKKQGDFDDAREITAFRIHYVQNK